MPGVQFFAAGAIGTGHGIDYYVTVSYTHLDVYKRQAAAAILRGKHKVDFAPHVDCGDHVIIINAEKAILTGKKLEKKFYRHHSGWVGGLKEIRYDHLMRENPEKAMMLAVKGMLPDNTLGRKACLLYTSRCV